MVQGCCRVTVFELLPAAGKDVGRSTRWVLFDNLKRYGVTISTDTKVTAIENGQVTYVKDDVVESRQFDTVILASGAQPVQTLTKKIEAIGIPYTAVGDCIQPGKIDHAIHGGFMAAVSL